MQSHAPRVHFCRRHPQESFDLRLNANARRDCSSRRALADSRDRRSIAFQVLCLLLPLRFRPRCGPRLQRGRWRQEGIAAHAVACKGAHEAVYCRIRRRRYEKTRPQLHRLTDTSQARFGRGGRVEQPSEDPVNRSWLRRAGFKVARTAATASSVNSGSAQESLKRLHRRLRGLKGGIGRRWRHRGRAK